MSAVDELKEEKLNERQERFCQLYASDREFFGNGVQSYIEVYQPDQTKENWYKQACVSASEILSNPKVTRRINELLEECGFNEVAVDKQLAFLIHQHEDKKTKLGAISEYNKLKKRIVSKLEIKGLGKFEELSNEQLAKLADGSEKGDSPKDIG